MGLCKLCGTERTLIRAHIIPKAFHRDLVTDANVSPIIIGNHPKSFPKRNPGGLYDDELLCNPCERLFGDWDDYGARCFLKNYASDAEPMVLNGETLAYQLSNWDQSKIRLFVLSLLWRAAVTSNPIFERVDIGPYEPQLRGQILKRDPGAWTEFSVFLCRWQATPKFEALRKMQISPYSAKLGGLNIVKMFLGGFIFHVKVDKRPFKYPLAELSLQPGRAVSIVAREFEGSKDILALRPTLERYAEGSAKN